MEKFKSNYKSKQYEKEISKINIMYKGSSTLRDLLVRKLETSQEYEDAVEMSNDSPAPGLVTIQIETQELITNAKTQALGIGYSLNDKLNGSSRLTNYRFYIGTPYFDRNGSDPYPLYRLDDLRVSHIVQLVYKSIESVGLKLEELDISLLNIIVRIYRPGDILNFHMDREIFGENIYGIVLENKDKSRGLVLKSKSHAFMLDEEPGTIWVLSGGSRWEYAHGYSTYFNNTNDFVRISISFRFFQNLKQIPKKDYEL
jgi:hypothetical protein